MRLHDRIGIWERATLAALASGKPIAAAAQIGDAALAEFAKRFGKEIDAHETQYKPRDAP